MQNQLLVGPFEQRMMLRFAQHDSDPARVAETSFFDAGEWVTPASSNTPLLGMDPNHRKHSKRRHVCTNLPDVSQATMVRSPTISVIIPTYNEEAVIGKLVSSLGQLKPDEIIVVDGYSTDRTAEIAARQARVLVQPACRALQMNAGVFASKGEVLLFLHADARLGDGALEAIRSAMRNPSTLGGNLDVRYDGGTLAACAFTWINRWRRRFGIFYGDSGIFCRRSVFDALGGYKPWPILEDYEFARRLSKAGSLAMLDIPIWVSGRRWRQSGLLRTMWSWFWIQGLYLAGVSPHRLAKFYRPVRSDEWDG